MKVIILAGGGGSRLFPLSRSCFPKQFLKISGDKSLLAQTVLRFLPMVSVEDVIVVTNQEYLYHVKNELMECGADKAHIVVEPTGRNTAPAIALGVKYLQEKIGCGAREVMVVSPADHVIESVELFKQSVECAVRLAEKDKMVIFGVFPDKVETGYGYIEAGEQFAEGYLVKSFKEKPELRVAESYITAGNYFWNSGMYIFSADFMVKELAKYQSDIAAKLALDYAALLENFEDMPNISIDYAIAERSKHTVMLPLTCYWNDIGSWDAIYDILPKDAQGNALRGDCLAFDCKNSLLMGRDRLIAGIGLDDLLLVETDDVIVVAKKGESQRVKEVVGELKKRGRKEAEEHTTLYRSWGSTALLGEGDGYRMKKVQVKPGARLSLQMHYHRSEHWIVLSGTAEVTIGDSLKMVHENESVFIPQTVKHRLENPGKIPLVIIEVQNGAYVGEDDIVRFD